MTDTAVFKTWNRPTIGWKLECEETDPDEFGKSRLDAVEKAGLSLESAPEQELHVANTGTAIVVIYSILIGCMPCCMFFGGGPGPAGVSIVCTRICYIILGPIILSALDQMRDKTETNIDIASQFDRINDCVDDPYVSVDQSSIITNQMDAQEKIDEVRQFAWIVFYCMFAEFTIGICFVCAGALKSSGGGCSCNCIRGGQCLFSEEIRDLLQFYIKVGN